MVNSLQIDNNFNTPIDRNLIKQQLINVNTYRKLFKKIWKLDTYPYQLDAIDLVLKERISVHVWSRRIGKTITFSTLAVIFSLVPESDILLLAPFLNLADIAFRYIYKALNILGVKLIKANFKDHYIELENGTKILCASLKNISQVLGRSYDLVLLDEFAVWDKCDEIEIDSPKSIKDVIFAGETPLFQDLYPTLLERQGRLVIFSTFRRKKNLFYKLYVKYPHTLVTVYEAEHIPKDDLKRMEKMYKESNQWHIFEQEYLCKPLDTVFHGRVFNFEPKECSLVDNILVTPEFQIPLSSFDFIIGADSGYSHPFGLTLVGIYIPEQTGDGKKRLDRPLIVILDSWKKSQATLKEVSDIIKKWEQEYPILEYYMDYANQNVINELAISYDISFKNAIKEVEESISFINGIKDILYINTGFEMYNAFMDEWVNYRFRKDKIVKINDDMLDSFRYAIYSAYIEIYPDLFIEE